MCKKTKQQLTVVLVEIGYILFIALLTYDITNNVYYGILALVSMFLFVRACNKKHAFRVVLSLSLFASINILQQVLWYKTHSILDKLIDQSVYLFFVYLWEKKWTVI